MSVNDKLDEAAYSIAFTSLSTHGSSDGRRGSLANPVTFTPTSDLTNSTFGTALCNALSSSSSALTITPIGIYFTLPTCLRSTASNIVGLNAAQVHIDNFAALPASLLTIELQDCYFGVPSGNSNPFTSFDSNNYVQWNYLFANVPSVTSLSLIRGNLLGDLPSSIPLALTTLSVTNQQLTGTIPSTWYDAYANNQATYSALNLNFGSNRISGTIPADFFGALSSATFSTIQPYVSVFFDNNRLTGSIPDTLISPLGSAALRSFWISFGSNTLTGTIPTAFFPTNLLSATSASLVVDISSNAIDGSLGRDFFKNVAPTASITFLAANNTISGNLPTNLLPASYGPTLQTATLKIDLSNNSLSGTISPTLLTGTMQSDVTLGSISILLDNNFLTGSIPEKLFYTDITSTRDIRASKSEVELENGASSDDSLLALNQRSQSSSSANTTIVLRSITQWILGLSSNQLSGTVSEKLLANSLSLTSQKVVIVLSLSNNALSGTLPEGLFGYVYQAKSFTLGASNNHFTGAPPSDCTSQTIISLDMSSNLLNGSIPDAWSGCLFNGIYLSNNQYFTGTIPSGFLTNTTTFEARNTSLWGTLPAISQKLNLDLSSTYLQFCSLPSNASIDAVTYSGVCHLDFTEACNCPTPSYSRCSTNCGATTIGPVAPGFPPNLLPVAAPITPPVAGRTCLESTRPGPAFTCIQGVWTAASVNETTLTVPSGAGTVVVIGEFTPETVLIQGIGSSLQIDGCATNLTSVSVQVDPAQIETLGSSKTLQTLIVTSSTSGNCTTDLNNVNLIVSSKSSGCKKVKAQKVVSSDGTTMGAYFTLDKSGCSNTWWIILVSVICGIVFIGVVIFALLAVLWKPLRVKIRPYSNRAPPASQGLM